MARSSLKRSNRGTSSAGLAEHSPFPSDGVSQFSHEAAHNAPQINIPRKPFGDPHRTLSALIYRNERELQKLQFKLFALPPLSMEAGRVRGSIATKKAFLDRLYREQETGERIKTRTWRGEL
jgi:hypothetical protein